MNTKTKGDILAERIQLIAIDLENGLLGRAAYNELSKALAEYRAPWALGRSVNGFTLGEGQEWHRSDWTQEMLPDGWRPLMKGELSFFENDEQFNSGYGWSPAAGGCYKAFHSHCRTRRPIRAVDPYAELKKAHAEGKTIQYNSALECDWDDCADGCLALTWCYPVEYYRVKPKPVMVPIGPEDVTPGSALRHPLWPNLEYIIPSCVSKEGIFTKIGVSDTVNWTWEYMRREGVLVHRPGTLDADGKPLFVRCEKEAK